MDVLVRDANLPFRLAHKVVATLVQTAVHHGRTAADLTLDDVQTAAREITGAPVDFSVAQLQQALDPEHFVAVRTGLGGVAPQATAVLLDRLRRERQAAQEWVTKTWRHLEEADRARTEAAARLT